MKSSTPAEQVESANIFRQARLRAAQKNPELATLEKASEILYINREKLGRIEQDDPEKKTAIPHSDDVARMVEIYQAPELRHHFCANYCPLGEDIPAVEYENLDRISLRLLVALNRIEQVRDDLGDILVDGRVGDTEKKKFRQIVETLKNIAAQAGSLELWAEKNGLL